MSAMAYKITSKSTVFSAVCSGAHKKNIKLRVPDLCGGNPPVTASNAEKFPFDDETMVAFNLRK